MYNKGFLSNKREDRIFTNVPDWVMTRYLQEYQRVFGNSKSDKKKDYIALVRNNLSLVTEIQRECVLLYLDGYTLKTIAHLRNTRKSAVQENIRLAIERLKLALVPEYKVCKECGKDFPVGNKKQIYCNSKCRKNNQASIEYEKNRRFCGCRTEEQYKRKLEYNKNLRRKQREVVKK
jgi:predicted DNA-binding protein YlxM (UPF0122 family)